LQITQTFKTCWFTFLAKFRKFYPLFLLLVFFPLSLFFFWDSYDRNIRSFLRLPKVPKFLSAFFPVYVLSVVYIGNFCCFKFKITYLLYCLLHFANVLINRVFILFFKFFTSKIFTLFFISSISLEHFLFLSWSFPFFST
jgi:hypothetical protein